MNEEPTTPRPPQNPFVAAHATPPDHVPPHRSGWRWKASLAGVVAGGVLATAVAVPATWALVHDQGASTAGGQTATVPDQGSQSGQSGQSGLNPGYGTEPYGGQLGGLGGLGGQEGGQPGQQGGSTSQSNRYQTNATAAESTGVVLIDTQTTDGAAAGTGLVIDSSGLVLTNYHVVEGSTEVKVTVASSGATYDATVVGHDQKADIALLQLKGASGLDTVAVDSNGDPAVSDTITAVGNAEGQGYLSASSGTVQALEQSIDTQSEGTVDGEHLTGLIQTDAYVVGGYSGGALLDAQGEVVGITTAASSGGQSESYAVPIEDALSVAKQIEDGQSSSEVQIGPSAYLGVAVAEGTGGVQVGQVQSGGAAAGAGVRAGATITQIGSTRITSIAVLEKTMATYRPGDSVALHWRDASGAAQQATVTLGDSPVN